MTVTPAQAKRPYTPPLNGPWPALPILGARWPGPGRPAGPGAVIPVVAAAIVVAVSVTFTRPGIGWLVAALAGTVALIVAQAIPDRTPPGAPAPLVRRGPATRLGWDRWCWGAATVALLGVGTLRSAGWLFTLCVLTATLTGSLAITGGRSLRAIATGYVLGPAAAVRSTRWLGRGGARMRPRGARASAGRIAGTAGVSVGLLVVFGALFASADQRFADLVTAVVPALDAGTVAGWVFLFLGAVPLLGGAAFLQAAPADLTGLDRTEGRKVGRLEWAVPLGLLVLLFALFVAVQLAVLFGGGRHVRETDGLTYAGYARGGFWQLSFVTALTLAVLAGAARWAPRTRTADRWLLRGILGALSVLALVVVASALLRIYVYADIYGLTRLRLLVALCEGWFGLVLIMVLVAGVRIRAPWLPRAAIAAGVLALLGLAVANPDALIASHDIKRAQTFDRAYLSTLSLDAVPALDRIADPTDRICVLSLIKEPSHPADWRTWSLGREQARAILDDVPYYPPTSCWHRS